MMDNQDYAISYGETKDLCRNCGNETLLKRVARFSYKHELDPLDPEDFRSYDEYLYFSWDRPDWIIYEWAIYQCINCDGLTLMSFQLIEGDEPSDGYRLYPPDILGERRREIPEKVYEVFEPATRKNLGLDQSVMNIRRTLDSICKEQGINGNDLHNQIQSLITKQDKQFRSHLHSLRDSAIILKDLGNAATHADPIKYESREVDIMIELVSLILEITYVFPNRIKRLSSHMEKLMEKLPPHIQEKRKNEIKRKNNKKQNKV